MDYNSDDLGSTIQKTYKRSRTLHDEWRKEARICYDMVAGHQWEPDEEADLKAQNRLPIKFNRIQKFVNATVGLQIQNRQEVRYLPREISDNQIAELLSEAARYSDDQCEGEDEITDAFEDMTICGMGWTDTLMDYTEGPDGKLITAERMDPLEMEWDANAKKRNLADAKWIAHGRNFPYDEAIEKWPEIKEISPSTAELMEEDVPVIDATENWKYEGKNASGAAKQNKVLVIRCQWYQDRKVMYLIDPETRQLTAMARSKFNKTKEMVQKLYGVDLQGVPGLQRKYYQAFVVNDIVVEKYEMPCPAFTMRAMCANRDHNKKTWYGLVRAQIDPQKFSNKFFSDFAFIIATNRKGGAFIETGALVDPKKAERDWSSPDALISLNRGGLNQIRERDAGEIPRGVEQLMALATQVMPDIAGMSAEMMGQVDRNQPGVLEETRKETGVTMLAKFFDALKRHSRMRGFVVMKYIVKYMNDGRIIRISTPTGKREPAPLNIPKDLEYDIVVDEASTTPNSKRQTLGVLLQLLPTLQAMQIPIPPSVIEYLPLPSTLQEEWKQLLQPKEEKQQSNPLAEAEAVKGQFELQKEQMRQQPKMADLQLKAQKQQAEQQVELKQLIHDEIRLALEALGLELERGKLEVDAREAGVRLALDKYKTIQPPRLQG